MFQINNVLTYNLDRAGWEKKDARVTVHVIRNILKSDERKKVAKRQGVNAERRQRRCQKEERHQKGAVGKERKRPKKERCRKAERQ